MKTFARVALLALLLVTSLACASKASRARESSAAHAMPEVAKVAEHAWLQQLVGEWTATSEASMGPGTEPMKMESTESVRSLDGVWVVAEGKATFEGTPVTSLLTLGYDPQEKTFVGTWVDTMHTHLWTYVGRLDEAKKVLTLEAEGPAFEDPSKSAKYRDAIEIRSPDHKVLTSSMQGEDGQWTTYLTAEYRNKK